MSNVELNEKDLANVSGAGDGEIMMEVREVCSSCAQKRQGCESKLLSYVKKTGVSVNSPLTCPFNDSMRRA